MTIGTGDKATGWALPVLFEDRRFRIVNKPAGLKVHGGAGGGESVETLAARLWPGREGPYLAHRLDADTSGCLLLALRRSALRAAQAAFAARQVTKIYWAMVEGGPDAPEGTLDNPLAKRNDKAGWRIVADPAGQPSLTAWRVLARHDGRTLLELRPLTGRTHQLRVHCAHAGFPIAGDVRYGRGGDTGLQLLARALRLDLDPPVAAEAPPLPAMAAILTRNV